jgi:hypothetical protein
MWKREGLTEYGIENDHGAGDSKFPKRGQDSLQDRALNFKLERQITPILRS